MSADAVAYAKKRGKYFAPNGERVSAVVVTRHMGIVCLQLDLLLNLS